MNASALLLGLSLALSSARHPQTNSSVTWIEPPKDVMPIPQSVVVQSFPNGSKVHIATASVIPRTNRFHTQIPWGHLVFSNVVWFKAQGAAEAPVTILQGETNRGQWFDIGMFTNEVYSLARSNVFPGERFRSKAVW